MPGGKGKGKKTRGGSGFSSKDNTAAAAASSSHMRQSRSRNTTPASTTISEKTLMSGDLGLSPKITYQDILDKYVNAGPDTSIPPSSTLTALASDLKALSNAASKRAEICAARMAELAEKVNKKQAEELQAEREEEEKEREKIDRKKREREERERDRKGRDFDYKKKKDKGFGRHGHVEVVDKRPHTHGAHQLTGQVPPDTHIKEEGGYTFKNKKKRKADTSEGTDSKHLRSASSSPKSLSSETSSDRQPTPIPPAIVYDHFENDDTVYHIDEVTPEMSIEDKCRNFSVAGFPLHDLTALTPGDPPDEDFTKAKPANQVMYATFQGYIEPYFRNFTEEDVAFLRERGDRVAPYDIPPLGQHYSEIWAHEDGRQFPSPGPSSLVHNGPKGSPDMLNDDHLENEREEISLGPLMSRILAGMVFEDVNEINSGGEASNFQVNGDEVPSGAAGTHAGSSTALPGMQDASFRASVPKTDYAALEGRLKQEMRFIGLIGPNDEEPDWKAQEDDEISARLRFLQEELRKQSILNGARKARLSEILKEQLAYQEYATILDDLDKQLEQAYTKRTRNIKAKKKKVVPNGAGIAMAKPAIGDATRTLMERRRKWRELIGPVFDDRITRIPKESIFSNLEEYERLEEMGVAEDE